MSKLWLIGLAASAAWTPAAIAQGAPPPPPPPPIAHGAHAPGHGGMSMQGGSHHSMPPAMHGGGQMHGQMHGQMKGFQRFGRGHVIPPHFRGRQFVVQDWRTFGFPAPMQGGQWIRYYDDALLIDGDGRVMDGRYGWEWDRGGDRMAHGDDHDGDYGRDDDYDDGEWAEGGHHGDRQRVVRVIRRGDGPGGDRRRSGARVRHIPSPHPGYGQAYGYGQAHGYGQAYGYGYGYGAGCGCGPVVITETTTTTAPVVEMRTYYETVREPRVAPRRHYSKPVVRHYSKPVVRRSVKAAPAPRPGERG